MKDSGKLFVACFLFAMVPIVVVADILILGFVTMKIWNWFVPTIKLGLPALTLAQAVGLRMVYVCFTRPAPKEPSPEPTETEQYRYLARYFGMLFLWPWFTLLIAYIVKCAMF